MTSIELHRVEPDRNMRRFYGLAIRPNLFGQTEVVRTWGRIGHQGGQVRVEVHESAALAEAAAQSWQQRKERRGYRPR